MTRMKWRFWRKDTDCIGGQCYVHAFSNNQSSVTLDINSKLRIVNYVDPFITLGIGVPHRNELMISFADKEALCIIKDALKERLNEV